MHFNKPPTLLPSLYGKLFIDHTVTTFSQKHFLQLNNMIDNK